MFENGPFKFVVAYLTLEQQLESLGHRWGNVCRAVEQRGAALERTVALWAGFDDLYTRFCDWLSGAETTVSKMESVDRSSDMHLITEQVQRLKVRTLLWHLLLHAISPGVNLDDYKDRSV